jgi:outer membrane protein assembly factor BamB
MLAAPILGLAVIICAGCGSHRASADWPVANRDLASTRASSEDGIDGTNVRHLHVAWRFRFPIRPRESGVFTATPIVVGDTVYAQDMESDVYALELRTGRLRWQRRFHAGTPGPNGIAVADGRVLGSTDTTAFALEAGSGRVLWQRRLVSLTESFVDIAPVVSRGIVYTSTVGYGPGSRGALYALSAETGALRWKFSTIRGPWRYPREAGGGGAWQPVSVDAEERVYAGVANPTPWGGSRRRPNGGAFPGAALYTDSLLVLNGMTGRLLWYDQVTPHDVRDYDFQISPILATPGTGADERNVVFGAGKAGRVIAWDRDSRHRVWETRVGRHRNDVGPLPRRPASVCPGLFGGVLTPMAYAAGRLFVPVVDLCFSEDAYGKAAVSFLRTNYAKGKGELVALDASTGRRLWIRRFPAPNFGCATVSNDVVFAATYDGRVYALSSADGRTLWSVKARAGINACPAVARDVLLVGAGVEHPSFDRPVFELIAYRLSD